MKQKHLPLLLLKSELRKRKISYREIARELSISLSSVCHKIGGRSDFYIHEMNALCERYGLDYRLFL